MNEGEKLLFESSIVNFLSEHSLFAANLTKQKKIKKDSKEYKEHMERMK